MDSKKRIYMIFALLTLVQLATIIYSFQFRKEGTHSDELWSYGYANGFYTREIFMDDDENLINMNEWIPCKQLWDYLVVNEGEQFRFDSVYYNKQNDISPFLHSMILHAICSFFPETFSLWYSFIINIISFLICMLFLFKTARLLKDDTFAICCCIWYGFSLAARDTFIYLRMYAMSTAIIMMYLYFTVKYIKIVKEDRKQVVLTLSLMFVVACIGFITNFYNISFIGIATFLICLYLLFHRKIKYMFAYGFSMLAALGISLLMLPSLFTTASSFGEDVGAAELNYTFIMWLKVFLNCFLKKLCNITVSVYYTPTAAILGGVLIYMFILLIPILFLLRKTSFIQKGISKVKYIFSHKRESIKCFLQWINWIYVILFLVIVIQVLVVYNTSYVESMGIYVDRYIFFLYPVAVLVIFGIIYSIFGAIPKRRFAKRLVLSMIFVLVAVNIYTRMTFQVYLFPTYTKGEPIEKAVEGKNCIFLDVSGWQIVSMSSSLMKGKNYFHTLTDEYENFTEEYMKKMSDGPVLLIVNMEGFASKQDKVDVVQQEYDIKIIDNVQMESETLYENMIDYFEALIPETKMKKISSQFVFGREIVTFIINP